MPTLETVAVPALCAFTHKGRSFVRGELVKLPPVEALALARVGKVSLSRHYQTRDVAPEVEPEPEAPRRRRYRRRDMTAETE